MLKIIFSKVNPNTIKFKKMLQMANADKHNGCMAKLLDNVAVDYLKIIKRKQAYNNYLMHLFDVLETVKKSKFNAFIDNEYQAFETNRYNLNYGPEDLIWAIEKVYNNLFDQGVDDCSKGKKQAKRDIQNKNQPSYWRSGPYAGKGMRGSLVNGQKSKDIVSRNRKV